MLLILITYLPHAIISVMVLYELCSMLLLAKKHLLIRWKSYYKMTTTWRVNAVTMRHYRTEFGNSGIVKHF